jgi:hypothetical protein
VTGSEHRHQHMNATSRAEPDQMTVTEQLSVVRHRRTKGPPREGGRDDSVAQSGSYHVMGLVICIIKGSAST